MYFIFKIEGSGVCSQKMFTSYPITRFNVHSQCLTAPGGQDCSFGHKKKDSKCLKESSCSREL